MRTTRISSRPEWVSTRHPLGGSTSREETPPRKHPPDRKHPPLCEQNSWHTPMKILPCPKLRLRAVTIMERRTLHSVAQSQKSLGSHNKHGNISKSFHSGTNGPISQHLVFSKHFRLSAKKPRIYSSVEISRKTDLAFQLNRHLPENSKPVFREKGYWIKFRRCG